VIVSQADDCCGQPPSYLEAVASLDSLGSLEDVSAPPYSPEPNIKRNDGLTTTIHIE
jgi:hypothetical protein